MPVTVPDYGAEDRWTDYPLKALAHGVRSSLSLPLTVDGTSIGALNFYADQVAHFGEPETRLAQVFARQAATALALVLRHAAQNTLETQLREAVAVRTVVDQALGIIMDNNAAPPPTGSRSCARHPSTATANCATWPPR